MSDKPRCASCSDRVGATTRRGVLRWFGSVMAATTAWGLATLTGQPRAAAESPHAVPTHPAPPRPVLLPPGQRSTSPLACDSCDPSAEYVCSNCCVGDVCCSGNLYRQLCFDDTCQPYYTYWCA